MSSARIRSRTGSWSTFERRFRPRTQADDTVLVDIHALPAGTDAHRLWTVVDEDGHFYRIPPATTALLCCREARHCDDG